MNLSDVTFEQLIGLAVVVVIAASTYNTIMAAIKNHLEAKKRHDAPIDTLTTRVDAHDKMLSNDKRRLEDMDERLSILRGESAMMLKGVRALLSHEINGNSDDKLIESYDSIDNYLINKLPDKGVTKHEHEH